MDRAELDRALAVIDVETYLDTEGVSYHYSHGSSGLQLNLDDCPACGNGGRKTYINASTGLGSCFHGSCGFKFNKFKLIQKVSGLGGKDLDAHIAAAAELAGWVPKKQRVEIVRGALELPSKLMPIPGPNGQNIRYLAQRGITVETAQHFHLTFCRGGWWGYKLDDGTEKWVSYDKRLIIPITDLDGTLVSFQGRDMTGTQEPKYLFPAGYAVAGSHLLNAQNFQDGEHTHAIINEGAFDVAATHQALQHPDCRGMLAVGTFGMHLSSGPGGQLEKFGILHERGLRTATFMWDGEGKALEGAVKAGLQLAGQTGLQVRIAQLPDGKDPNEVTPDVVRQAIFRATALNRINAVRLLHAAMLMKARGT